MTFAILSLRGTAAVGVLLALVGGTGSLAALALAVAAGAWSAVLVASHAAGVDAAPGGVIAVSELAIGGALGVAAAFPLLAARTASAWIDHAADARGFYGRMLGVVAAAVFVGVDGHVRVIRTIVESHAALPAIGEVKLHVWSALASLVGSAVALATPWLVTIAVVALATGVGARIAARTARHVPTAIAAPALVAMASAAFVAVFATAFARIVIAA
jgi:hypothetical protein